MIYEVVRGYTYAGWFAKVGGNTLPIPVAFVRLKILALNKHSVGISSQCLTRLGQFAIAGIKYA